MVAKAAPPVSFEGICAVANARVARAPRAAHIWHMADEHSIAFAVRAGLLGRCPRCGKGHLFEGPLTLKVRQACKECGLDNAFVDSGDGPAVFVIIVLGFLMLGAALILEFKLSPPLWVHMLVWVPLALLLGFGLLRPMKATLIALQYRNRAEEARLEHGER